MEKEIYHCPLCKTELTHFLGEQVHQNMHGYGITLYCPSIKCPAQEVSGHGKDAKDAYKTIMQKFMGER